MRGFDTMIDYDFETLVGVWLVIAGAFVILLSSDTLAQIAGVVSTIYGISHLIFFIQGDTGF